MTETTPLPDTSHTEPTEAAHGAHEQPVPASLAPETPAALPEPEPAQSEVQQDEHTYEDDEPQEPAESGFAALGLSEAIVRAVTEKGYTTPTPIQAQAIPYVLMGRDLLGCAQTGTGKTAGFTLPMMDILDGSRARARMPRSLILEPTRELALQVAENFIEYGKYMKLTHALVIAGAEVDKNFGLAARNIPNLDVLPNAGLNVYDVLRRRTLVLTKDAVEAIQARFHEKEAA